jgi:hypothetical protein
VPKRRDVSAAERVELVTEWLHDNDVPANVIFRDGEKWAISGQNFPLLPAILRQMARECEAQLADNKTVN